METNLAKQIILSHLMDYLKLRKIPYRKSGRTVTMVQCPFCNEMPMSANVIPNTHIINCFTCDKKYNLIDIHNEIEHKSEPLKEEQIIQELKDLLNIKVTTKLDEQKITKYLDFYEKNNFDIVPIAKNGKVPIEKDWTNKEHKDKSEWEQWIANGLNIGIKTGIRSEITIIDIDQKPIPEDIRNLMGDTLIQESTKGFHLFYQYEEELPKTRIDELKIDIENDGGQVVIYPSIVKGIERKMQISPIIKMPNELKEFLKSKTTVPRQTESEEIKEDIQTESFKLNLFEEGTRNCSLIKLGGVFRKVFNPNDTKKILHILNNHNHRSGSYREIEAMARELEKYSQFDEQELAHKILEYIKDVEEASRNEIAMTIVGTNRGEDKKRVDKALQYLVREGYITKKGTRYGIMQKANWKTNLISIGIPIDFEIPYFNDIMSFNWGDLILIGSGNARGKTHISMNIIKQLVKQKKNPKYLSLESGSRFAKIALQLGLKEGDFEWDEVSNPAEIKLEQDAITVIDWICPNSYAEVDKLLQHFTKQLQRRKGIAIIFMQLRDNNEWLAKDLIKQFPSFACRYIYDNKDSGEYGRFEIDKARDPKIKNYNKQIPCAYDWETKELKKIED